MTPLRRRMIEDMQVRNLAPHTQRAYLQLVSLFSLYSSPCETPPHDQSDYPPQRET